MAFPRVSLASLQSLHLTLLSNGKPVSQATGFVVIAPLGPVLLTNWHVVSGRDPKADGPLVTEAQAPDEMVIAHHRLGRHGSWVERNEPLYESSQRLWRGFKYPSQPQRVDVAALPLTQLDDVELYPHTLGENDPKIQCGPADSVSVIGFPFDVRVGGSLPVWANGFIASDPDINYNDLPIFLIDCRTRSGQSGSPVIAYRSDVWVAMEDGNSASFGGPAVRFLGIFSGRISKASDLGVVWKAEMLRDFVALLT